MAGPTSYLSFSLPPPSIEGTLLSAGEQAYSGKKGPDFSQEVRRFLEGLGRGAPGREDLIQDLSAISRSRDPDRFFREFLALGTEAAQAEDGVIASSILRSLTESSDFFGREIPEPIREEAEVHWNRLQRKGGTLEGVAGFVRRLPQDVFHWGNIGGMFLGGAVFQRLYFRNLSRLAHLPKGLWTRGIVAEGRAALSPFAAELAGFWGVQRVYNQWRHPDLVKNDLGSIAGELAYLAATLAPLKLGIKSSLSLYNRAVGFNPLRQPLSSLNGYHRIGRGLAQQMGAYGGVISGTHFAQGQPWSPEHAPENIWTAGVGTLLHLHFMGLVTNYLAGPRYTQWMLDTRRAIHEIKTQETWDKTLPPWRPRPLPWDRLFPVRVAQTPEGLPFLVPSAGEENSRLNENNFFSKAMQRGGGRKGSSTGRGGAAKSSSRVGMGGESFDPSSPEYKVLKNWRRYIFDEPLHRIAEVQKDQIFGIDQIISEVDKIVQSLKNFKKLNRVDPPIELPAGFLHKGERGTGKTLLARYLATASGALCVDLTRFPHLDREGLTRADIRAAFYVGHEYVRKKGRPVVLFWEEMDKFFDGDCNYKMETAQELSTQLSGLYGNPKGVLLVGTTNRAGALPEDLITDERRMKVLEFPTPDRAGRALLLKKFLSRYPHEKGIDYEALSYLIPDNRSAAAIEKVVKEAWRVCRLREGETQITKKVLTDLWLRDLLGQVDNRTFTREEEEEMALHEICHAVVGRELGVKVPVISMRSTIQRVSGMSISVNKNQLTQREFYSWIAVRQAGLAATKLFQPQSLGHHDDINMATQWAVQAVESYGLPKNFEGFSVFGLYHGRSSTQSHMTRHISEALMQASETAVRKICRQQLAVAEKILKNFGEERLRWLAQHLRENRVILEDEFNQLFAEAKRRFR